MRVALEALAWTASANAMSIGLETIVQNVR